MDFTFASGRLSVKLADLKRVENQILQLEGKSNQQLIEFLNHLQISGTSEYSDFNLLIRGAEQFLFGELVALIDEEHYYLLDLVYAEEILTFLNLKLHDVKYQKRFDNFDILHLSLTNLLSDKQLHTLDYFTKMIESVRSEAGKNLEQSEARLVKHYYDYLLENFGDNKYLSAKLRAINTRTLVRANLLELSKEEYVTELVGDDTLIEKYTNYYRLEQKQLISTLSDKVDTKIGNLYQQMIENRRNADKYVDDYLNIKLEELVFSSEFNNLFIRYAMIKKRIIKTLKKMYYQVEAYETNSNN